MRRDQAVGRDDGHAATFGRNEPELLELRDDERGRLLRLDALGVDDDLGFAGASYGSSTPVKPLISPANAFA